MTTTDYEERLSIRDVIDFFDGVRALGDITSNQRDLLLKRWAQHGRVTNIVYGGFSYRWNEEAIRCDCGKGLCCPLVVRIPAYRKAVAR